MALLMGAPHLRPSQGAGEEKRSPCCGLLECMIRVLCDCDVVGMDGSRMDTGEGEDRRRTEGGGRRAARKREGTGREEGGMEIQREKERRREDWKGSTNSDRVWLPARSPMCMLMSVTMMGSTSTPSSAISVMLCPATRKM